ncbi:hypothetical protein ACFWA9_25180 [Kitasatospora sp. NPDC059973]|uniref:hypothetical protein n=1 Tax=Kitasatospora sp. NPDC059973 TaxID=3347020 RepID=UPI0036C1EE1C
MNRNLDHPGLTSWLDGGPACNGWPTDTEAGGRTEVFTGTAAAPPVQPPRITVAPAPFPSAHEQAAHELSLAIALVLNAPQAGASLKQLVNGSRIHPEGALVLACLLALTGRVDAAQFWWQFAAGSGSTTAAYLLHLHHQQAGETRDAAYWRAQAENLAENSRHRAGPHRPATTLLPEQVRHDILARCHDGLAPRLPPRLQAVLNQLVVDGEDEDFGEIPQPSASLVEDLAAAR